MHSAFAVYNSINIAKVTKAKLKCYARNVTLSQKDISHQSHTTF